MKKLLSIIILGLLFCNLSYAGSFVVCQNILDLDDTVVVAVDEEKKTINWNKEVLYYLNDGQGYGTGKLGSPMIGDLWGMDKTGTRAFAINRFTYKARKRDMVKSVEDLYECRKTTPENMLF